MKQQRSEPAVRASRLERLVGRLFGLHDAKIHTVEPIFQKAVNGSVCRVGATICSPLGGYEWHMKICAIVILGRALVRITFKRVMTPNTGVTGLTPAQAVELPPKPAGGRSELT